MLEFGIQTNLGAQAIHMLSYYAHKYSYSPDDFPNARKAYIQGLALPIGHHINHENIDFIAEKLQTVLSGRQVNQV
jgi:dTDP-4-amino-4,6-dideoxygalactose transaminase